MSYFVSQTEIAYPISEDLFYNIKLVREDSDELDKMFSTFGDTPGFYLEKLNKRCYLKYILHHKVDEGTDAHGTLRFLSVEAESYWQDMFNKVLHYVRESVNPKRLKWLDYCWYNASDCPDYYAKFDAKRLFISQPMAGRADEAIKAEREAALKKVKAMFVEDVEEIDTFFDGATENPLILLGESIKLLAGADVAIFCKDWEKYRGCVIEHECAVRYNIKCLYM